MHGNSNEPPLVGNPFYCESMCGKNREVNWDRSHTAVQLEDCEDFFFSLFSYDSVWIDNFPKKWVMHLFKIKLCNVQ